MSIDESIALQQQTITKASTVLFVYLDSCIIKFSSVDSERNLLNKYTECILWASHQHRERESFQNGLVFPEEQAN